MCLVVLFNRMFDNLEILSFHDGIVVNTENNITYNGGRHEVLVVTSDVKKR